MAENLLSNTRVDASSIGFGSLSFAVDAGPLSPAYERAIGELERSGFPDALWNRSLEAWAGDASVREKIANRLGWLSALDFLSPQLERLNAFAGSVRDGGFTDVVLLGMGGSSLAPEVLRRVLGVTAGYPRFRMLDSVDPDAVRDTMENAATSLFILASKSGSTIEPSVMAAEARRRVLAAGHHDWGRRFVAITDEGSPFHRRAIEERFRDIFVNPSDIGGRYSALSYFGMVPAAAMGADLQALLAYARGMEKACRESHVPNNPGLALGALLAAGASSGRDKLTLLLPQRLQSFGLWVEQLVAESTGKAGKGVVPITGEPLSVELGDDRVAVTLTLGTDTSEETPITSEAAGRVPSVRLEMPDAKAIGAEFLRWEVATAAAGLLLEINPFDEPNVQQAKDATRMLLTVYAHERRLPTPEPHASIGGARLTMSQGALDALAGASAGSFLGVLRAHDYFCLLAFLPPDAAFEPLLQDLRTSVAARTRCATMFGYGPRYLHSTGQLHKGGPNSGVFLILTAEPGSDLPIPGESFTFGTLEQAQALGDFQSLDRAGRRALYVHLPNRDPEAIRRLSATLLADI
jgi:transaldolase / glucose-6-phosphate isomerase